MPDPVDPRLLAELLEGRILPMGVIPGGASRENWNADYQREPLAYPDMKDNSPGARTAYEMMRETNLDPVRRWQDRASKRYLPTEEINRSYDPRTPIY